MNKQSFVIIMLCMIAGYSFAKSPMDDEIKNPFTGVKKLFAAKDSGHGSGSVTVNAGSTQCLIKRDLCVAVQYIVKNKEVGNGAAFSVSLPHKTFTARVKAGREFIVKLKGKSYVLKLDSVSVDDNSATFSLVEGGEHDDES